MEYHSGPEGTDRRSTLRLVDPERGEVWEPDPAGEADELDALTELFIGEPGVDDEVGAADAGGWPESERRPSGRDDGRSAAHESASVEAIITGHLPVRGTVWVRAYAARVARELGSPVGLVRVSPDRTAVELVGSAAEAEPIADIGVAIEAARSAADTWLLHFDELDQASLLRAGTLDRITVLSGADEPAIVSAYRLFKTMVELGEDGVRAGVSIVGSGPDDTERAATRIVGATRQFLGMELEARVHVPRVEAARVTLLGDCDRRLEPGDVIRMIQEADEDLSAPVERARGTVEPRMAGGPTAPVVLDDEPEPARVDIGTGEAESVDSLGELPDPASLVPDLKPLGVPCPVAPMVSLAADNAGRLHVLAWWSPEAPGELLKAAAWGRVNIPLLARVCVGLNAEPCTPAQHIVCVDLAVAADLRGTKTLVHLAQPVEQRPTHGWVCGRVN